MRLMLVYEAIAVTMVIVACFAEDKGARAAAVMVAVSRFVGDMAWIYLPLAPATWMHALGCTDFTGTDTRALTDGVITTVIAVLYLSYWWGKALWAALISMLFAHVLRSTADMGYIGYAYAVNGLFLAMAAVFFRLGGGGAIRYVRDLLHRNTDRRHAVRDPSRPTRREI